MEPVKLHVVYSLLLYHMATKIWPAIKTKKFCFYCLLILKSVSYQLILTTLTNIYIFSEIFNWALQPKL